MSRSKSFVNPRAAEPGQALADLFFPAT